MSGGIPGWRWHSAVDGARHGRNRPGNCTRDAKHSLVLWPFHGVFGSGPTLDETFGLIDTAEKSAQVLVKVYSMGGMKQTISREELIALGQRFGVTPLASALAL